MKKFGTLKVKLNRVEKCQNRGLGLTQFLNYVRTLRAILQSQDQHSFQRACPEWKGSEDKLLASETALRIVKRH